MAGARYDSLKGKTAIVTGGASGIGEAIVHAFARQGARVGVLDSDTVAGARVAGALGEAVRMETVDVRDIGALKAAIAKVRSALGPIGILVNNAGRDDRQPSTR